MASFGRGSSTGLTGTTSGLLIAAKNDGAHLALAQQLQDHSLYREYEAVVCPNDAIAIYLVNYLKQQGITVPDDLFVASFGNMAIGRYHRPSITSMTMDMQYVGKQAFSVWRHLMKSEQSMQRIA